MHVFTYGSLMFAPVWERVVRGSYRSARARLDAYARFAVRGQSYPGIVPMSASHVDGLLYFDVAANDLDALDRFEGAEYARTALTVRLEDGVLCEAAAYVYLIRENLASAPWQPERFDPAAFLLS